MRVPGPAGELEALLEWAPEARPALAALVCHPHPLYGGTLHNKVVFRAAKAALTQGVPALRFNFRGVGKSQGTHDKGAGELDDVRAALDFLSQRFAGLPVLLMGFSFGCWVGLRAGARDARVAAMAGLGLPTIDSDFSSLAGVTKPKLIVQGTRDQYGERSSVQAVFDSLAESKRIHWVEGADHFFTGRLAEVQSVLEAFVREMLERVSEPREQAWRRARFRVDCRSGDAMGEVEEPQEAPLYCPACDREVDDPLVCGDCSAVICRRCGTPLEKIDELGIG